MSPYRIVTLKLSALLIALTAAYPPFIYGSLFGNRNFQGFAFVFGESDGASIDVITLIAEWAFVSIITTIFYKLDGNAPIPKLIIRRLANIESPATSTLAAKFSNAPPQTREAIAKDLEQCRKDK